MRPRSDLTPNSFDYENLPLVTANGFREYDARWLFGKEINLLGVTALGLGLFTGLGGLGVWFGLLVGLIFVAGLMHWRWANRAKLGLLPT